MAGVNLLFVHVTGSHGVEAVGPSFLILRQTFFSHQVKKNPARSFYTTTGETKENAEKDLRFYRGEPLRRAAHSLKYVTKVGIFSNCPIM